MLRKDHYLPLNMVILLIFLLQRDLHWGQKAVTGGKRGARGHLPPPVIELKKALQAFETAHLNGKMSPPVITTLQVDR